MGQADPPQGESLVSISAGTHHTCGLKADGSAVCWGEGIGGRSPFFTHE